MCKLILTIDIFFGLKLIDRSIEKGVNVECFLTKA